MADELSIKVGVELDAESIESQLKQLQEGKGGKVKVQIDTSEVSKQVSDLKKSIQSKTPAKILVDILKGQSNANINSYINEVQTRFQSKPIKITLDVDKKATEANIQAAIGGMQQNIQNAANTQKSNAGQKDQTIVNRNLGLDKAEIVGYTKYVDELNNAIQRYGAAFEDAQAKVSKIRISNNDISETQTAIVSFSNAIGELTNVTFKFEDGDWTKISDSFSKSFADNSKEIESTLKDLQKYQNQLDVIFSKGFERGNRLNGNFAKPVTEGIDKTRAEVERFVNVIDKYKEALANLQTGKITQGDFDKVTESLFDKDGLDGTIAKVGELSQEIKKLDLLRIKQQNTQYQERQLSATDITKQIPIIKNEVATLENRLKNIGFGDKFKSDITNLKDMLKTLGQDGGTTVQQINSEMRRIKSESDLLKTRPYGQGLIESQSISKNQLQDIKSITKVLNQNLGTEGIQEAKNKVDALAASYQKLQAQLQSSKISNQRLTDIKRIESEYDQQLSGYQKLANALNGDSNSQKWVAQQEAGIAQMKTKFAEYQQEIQKTIQLTPELENRLNSLAQTMGRDGAIDVANWQIYNNQFKELAANIEQYADTIQGKASQLSISIDSSQLQDIQRMTDMLNNIGSQYSGAGVENLKANLQSLATEYRNVVSQLQTDNLTQDQFDALSQRVQQLDQQLQQAANSAKIFSGGIKNDADLKKFEQNAESLRLKFQQLRETYADLIKQNPQIAGKFDQIGESLNKVDPTNIQEETREVNNLGKACQVASGQSAGLRGALQDAFGGLGGYIARFASATYLITKAVSTFKSMVNEVKAVNSSIVELQKVTDLAGSSLDGFVDKAYKVGATLGRTGQDVIDATTTFSRAGYDLQEATDLAQSALVMTNIGVDIASTEAAASDMISIMKAFDVQAEDSMAVIDKLYNVANKEPLDFGNITQMLVTAGGTLAQTGTSLEETMGLLTGAFATMRDTSVSNG